MLDLYIVRDTYLHYFILPAGVVHSLTCQDVGSSVAPHGQVMNALSSEKDVQGLYEVQQELIAFGETCRHVIFKAGQRVLLSRETFDDGMLSLSPERVRY